MTPRNRLRPLAAAALLTVGAGIAVTASIADAAGQPVTPTRVLDTRSGLGGHTGRVDPGTVLRFAIPAADAAGASSVSLNLTATDATGAGYATAWPCAQPMPATSSLNFTPGQAVANMALLGYSGDGLCLATSAPVHLIADLGGYFTGNSDVTPIAPARIVDTRQSGDPLGAGSERRVAIAGSGGVPGNAAAAAVNLTVVGAAADGYLTAYPCGQATDASTVNFRAGEDRPNFTVVGLSAGQLCVKSSVDAGVIVDVFGWSGGAGSLGTVTPARLMDTRQAGQQNLASGEQRGLLVAGLGGVPSNAAAALLTITIDDARSDGYVTAWPCGQPRPETSVINLFPGVLRSNLALVRLAGDGTICLTAITYDGSPVQTIVDVVGYVTGSGGAQGGCTLAKADLPANVAFCDTFDAPQGNPATRAGDLNPTLWGVSRLAAGIDQSDPGQGRLNVFAPATLHGCGSAQTVLPHQDVRICGGRLLNAVNDGGGQTVLAMYPKQPFDIAGRTGTVSWDMSADSQGVHAAWPEFWWTDQPVPAPAGELTTMFPYARNSFGVSFAGCSGNQTGVDKIMVTRNHQFESVNFNSTGCVTKGSATGQLNHFELRLSESRAEVWASEPGSKTTKMIAVANLSMPLTRGVVWLNDVHYNACKLDSQCNHTFAWDNLAFDGPEPYRDLTFDVQDALTPAAGGNVNLGYLVGGGGRSLSAPGVTWLQTPTHAYVGMNWFAMATSVPDVRVNGGQWVSTGWIGGPTFGWRTIAVEVPLADIRQGDNTIELRSGVQTIVSNVNVILIAAAPVP